MNELYLYSPSDETKYRRLTEILIESNISYNRLETIGKTTKLLVKFSGELGAALRAVVRKLIESNDLTGLLSEKELSVELPFKENVYVEGVLRYNLLNYFNLNSVGDFILDEQSMNVSTLYKVEDNLGIIVGRKGELHDLKKLSQNVVTTRISSVAMLVADAGYGKSLLAADLVSFLKRQGWADWFDYYMPNNKGIGHLTDVKLDHRDLGNQLAALVKTIDNIKKPLVWWVDDVHWMTQSDVDLLEQAVEFSVNPVLVVLTSRKQDIGLRSVDIRQIRLSSLNKKNVTNYIKQLTGAVEVDDGVLTATMECSNGHPLMVAELLNSWWTRGVIELIHKQLEFRDGRQISTNSLNYFIEEGLKNVGTDLKNMLQVISFLRGGCSEEGLGLLNKEIDVCISVDELIDTGLFVKRSEYYIYRHALISEAVMLCGRMSKERCHTLAIGVEKLASHWTEVCYHDVELNGKSSYEWEAFNDAFENNFLELAAKHGEALGVTGQIICHRDDFYLKMCRIYFDLGKRDTLLNWSAKIVGWNKWQFYLIGFTSALIPRLRKLKIIKRQERTYHALSEAYNLSADAHWMAKNVKKSVKSSYLSWLFSRMLEAPSSRRAEAEAGFSIILSMLPGMKKKSINAILNSQREAELVGNKVSLSQTKLTCMIAAFGVEFWDSVDLEELLKDDDLKQKNISQWMKMWCIYTMSELLHKGYVCDKNTLKNIHMELRYCSDYEVYKLIEAHVYYLDVVQHGFINIISEIDLFDDCKHWVEMDAFISTYYLFYENYEKAKERIGFTLKKMSETGLVNSAGYMYVHFSLYSLFTLYLKKDVTKKEVNRYMSFANSYRKKFVFTKCSLTIWNKLWKCIESKSVSSFVDYINKFEILDRKSKFLDRSFTNALKHYFCGEKMGECYFIDKDLANILHSVFTEQS